MQGSCPCCSPAGPDPAGVLLALGTLGQRDVVSMETHDACHEWRERDSVNPLGDHQIFFLGSPGAHRVVQEPVSNPMGYRSTINLPLN